MRADRRRRNTRLHKKKHKDLHRRGRTGGKRKAWKSKKKKNVQAPKRDKYLKEKGKK